MIEPTYVVQAAAWAVIWVGAGLTARELIEQNEERAQEAAHRPEYPAGRPERVHQ